MQLWRLCQRPPEAGDGFFVVAECLEEVAARTERCGIIWVQLKRFLGVRQSFRWLARLEKGPGASAVILGVIWSELDRLAVIGDGPVEVTLSLHNRCRGCHTSRPKS